MEQFLAYIADVEPVILKKVGCFYGGNFSKLSQITFNLAAYTNTENTRWFNSISKKRLFCLLLLVLSPQPSSNPNQQLNQKQQFLPKHLEDDVAAPCSLLLLIQNSENKKKFDPTVK